MRGIWPRLLEGKSKKMRGEDKIPGVIAQDLQNTEEKSSRPSGNLRRFNSLLEAIGP